MIAATGRISGLARGALVIAWDGIAWWSARVIAADDGTFIECRQRGVADDPVDALVQAAAAQREAGGLGWRAVVMALPHVAHRALELPVDPARPLPPSRMASLASIHLQEALSGLAWSRSIGSALVAGDALTHEQIAAVLAEQQRRRAHVTDLGLIDEDPDDFASHRFGDCALDLGFVDRATINTAIARQSAGTGSREDAPSDHGLSCGWAPGKKVTTGQPRWRWSVAGMPTAEREDLTATARQQGLGQVVVVPLAGCAAALLAPGSSGTVVQNHHGVLSLTEVRSGVVHEHRLHSLEGVWPTAEEVAPILAGTRRTVWWTGDGMDDTRIAHLAEATGTDSVGLPPRGDTQPSPPTAAADPFDGAADGNSPLSPTGDSTTPPGDRCLEGALRLACGQGPEGLGAVIAADEMRTPLHARRSLWIAAALLIAVLSHLIPGIIHARVSSRITAADATIRAFSEEPPVDPLFERKERLHERIRQAEADLQAQQTVLGDGDAVAGRRRALLLDVLATTVPDAAVIDRIVESDDGAGLVIHGRGLHLTDALVFQQRAALALATIGWRQEGWATVNEAHVIAFTLTIGPGLVTDADALGRRP